MSVVTEKKVANENCCAKGCASLRSRNPGLHFHAVPRPNAQRIEILNDLGVRESWDRRELWIHKLQIKARNSRCVKVCSKHFLESDYVDPRDPKRRKHLKRNAVPSKFLPTQLPTNQADKNQLSKINRYCNVEPFDPSNLCAVKLEEPESEAAMHLRETITNPDDAIKNEGSDDEYMPHTGTESNYDEDEDVIFIQPDDIKDEVITLDEEIIEEETTIQEENPESIHEISNVKVMIIDNNAVLIKPDMIDVDLKITDKSTQVNIENFHGTIRTVTQLFSLTGIVTFQILEKIVGNVREHFPTKLKQWHNLGLEDRVLLCLIKSHLKLSTVVVAFFFKISPGEASIIYKDYYKIVMNAVKNCQRVDKVVLVDPKD